MRCTIRDRNIRVIWDASHCNPKVPEPVGVARLIVNRQVSSMVISHMGLNAVAQEMFAKGEIDIELNPMGTLERIGPVVPGSEVSLPRQGWIPHTRKQADC